MPVPSLRLPLGSRMPWFSVTALDGRTYTAADLDRAPLSLICFLCNHSPYVCHIEQELATVTASLQERGVAVIGISSNDPIAYPSDDREHMERQVDRTGWTFPYCIDDSQSAAKAFMANCTPEFFLYDAESRLVYHGQFDASRPDNDVAPSGRPLLEAVRALLDDDVVSHDQASSFGCSMKWRAGNEPVYLVT